MDDDATCSGTRADERATLFLDRVRRLVRHQERGALADTEMPTELESLYAQAIAATRPDSLALSPAGLADVREEVERAVVDTARRTEAPDVIAESIEVLHRMRKPVATPTPRTGPCQELETRLVTLWCAALDDGGWPGNLNFVTRWATLEHRRQILVHVDRRGHDDKQRVRDVTHLRASVEPDPILDQLGLQLAALTVSKRQ